MSIPKIEINSLFYKYPESSSCALSDISLEITGGSISILTGPTGSGKSTLLMLVRGFYSEYGGELSGEIVVDGENITSKSVGELSSKIGILMQDPASQLHQLTVWDEVASSLMYQAKPYDECYSISREMIVDILGEEFLSRSPEELSYGEQQKVALAAILVSECDVILLDEPFSLVDFKSADSLLEIILKLRERGKTIVICSHVIEEIAKYAGKVVLLNEGKVEFDGPPIDALWSEKIDRMISAPLQYKIMRRAKFNNRFNDRFFLWQDLAKLIPNPENRAPSNSFCDGEGDRIRKPILGINGLDFSYSEEESVFNDLSLEVEKGEILGILGPNGSGKSTLLKLIMGVLKPDSGEILFDGDSLKKWKVEERAKVIGYICQNPDEMIFEDSVINEVLFGPKNFDLAEPTRYAESALEKVRLLKYSDRHPHSLSGGEKRLLSIADMLAVQQDILLFDEPEFGLDFFTKNRIAGIIRKLRDEGKAILVVTHDLFYASFLCDRIAVMVNGKIHKVDRTFEVLTDKSVRQYLNLESSGFIDFLENLSDDFLRDEDHFVEAVSNILMSTVNEQI